jgi:hypothetical protein
MAFVQVAAYEMLQLDAVDMAASRGWAVSMARLSATDRLSVLQPHEGRLKRSE